MTSLSQRGSQLWVQMFAWKRGLNYKFLDFSGLSNLHKLCLKLRAVFLTFHMPALSGSLSCACLEYVSDKRLGLSTLEDAVSIRLDELPFIAHLRRHTTEDYSSAPITRRVATVFIPETNNQTTNKTCAQSCPVGSSVLYYKKALRPIDCL